MIYHAQYLLYFRFIKPIYSILPFFIASFDTQELRLSIAIMIIKYSLIYQIKIYFQKTLSIQKIQNMYYILHNIYYILYNVYCAVYLDRTSFSI